MLHLIAADIFHHQELMPLRVLKVCSESTSIFLASYASACPCWFTLSWWDVTVYVLDIKQPSLPTIHSVLVSVSVFVALSSVFHSINYPDSCLLSHSVLLVLFCLIGPFNYISLYESLPQP